MRAREGLPETVATKGRTFVRERRSEYSISIEIRTASGHLRVVDESLRALRADGEPLESRRPFLEKQGDRLHLRMERQAHPFYEDLGQDRAVICKGLYAPHYPHITAFQEELTRWRFYYLEPTAMREEKPLRDVESLDPRGAELAAFYNALKTTRPQQFNALGKSLKQVIPTIDGLDVERTPEGFGRLIVRDRDMRVSARLISEGTLRVPGLLASTNPLAPVSVVGYEEPENGVHPRRLALVAHLLSNAARRGSTQLLVNTHSPLLPEHFIGDATAVLSQCYRGDTNTAFEPFSASAPARASRDRGSV